MLTCLPLRLLPLFDLSVLCVIVSFPFIRGRYYFLLVWVVWRGVGSTRAEPEMEGLLCDLLWADPSDDPGVTNIESLSDQVKRRSSTVAV